MHVFLHFSLIILPHPLSVSQIHVSSLVEKFYSFLHMLTFLNFFLKKNLSEKTKKVVQENEASFEIFYFFVKMKILKLSDCSTNTCQQRTCYSTVMPNETKASSAILFHNQLGGGYFRPNLCPRIHQ
jgi:hypothetical protein